ncbi:DUF202 domain-containing protein [Sinisalibacter aestuarii]|nr:DUF202 domain-containing protein [Sinisalibacter aestuarii]
MIRNYADHASNERTFLAWVRTTIAVVGFGVAAARLGGAAPSPWADAAMLGSGALVVALAYLRMRMIRLRIDSGAEADDAGPRADAMLAILVIAFFGLLGTFALRLSV